MTARFAHAISTHIELDFEVAFDKLKGPMRMWVMIAADVALIGFRPMFPFLPLRRAQSIAGKYAFMYLAQLFD